MSPDHADRAAEFEALCVSDPQRGVATYDGLWRDLVAAGEVASAVRATRAAVQSLAHLGDTGKALAIAARARKTALADGSRAARIEAARVLVAAMHPRAKRGRLHAAMRGGMQAASELAALGEDALVARAELNLANVAKALGRPADAAAHLERVLARGAAIEQVRGAALNGLGEARVQTGDFARAVEAFEEAARFYEAQGGSLHAALARGNLAHTLAKAGDIEGALRAFRAGREQFRALGAHAEACRLTIEEAELLEDAGLLDDAADLVAEARVLARRHELRAELARSALVSGRLALARGRAAEACPAIDEAVEVAGSVSDRIAHAHALVARAACLMRLGDEAGAREAARAARTIADTPFERAVAAIAFVEAHAARDDVHDEARAAATDAIAVARSLALPALEAEAELAAATNLASAGLRSDALAAARRAVVLVEGAQDRLAVARLRRSFISHRGRAFTMLASQLLAHRETQAGDSRPSDLDEALDAVERARNRAIREAILEAMRGGVREAAEGVAPAPQGAAPSLDPQEMRANVLAQAARAARAAERSELDAELARTPSPPGQRAGPGASARPACDAIVFFEHGARLDAILVAASGETACVPIAGTALLSRTELDGEIGRFRFQVARRLAGSAGDRATRTARASFDGLRAMLFAPLAPWLALRRSAQPRGDAPVVVVPSPSLAGLPLCVLAPDEVMAVTAPSLGIAALLDENAASRLARAPRMLVTSVADAATPGLAREGARVAALAEGARHLDGPAATRAAFARELALADRAHIACHGLFPPTAPNLAGLLLADGWFGARDAHALRAAPREIVLSGCSTGLSADGAGEQWFGLLRGFAARGSASLVASLWPVIDAEAEAFMEALYAPEAAATSLAARALGLSRQLLAAGAHPATAAAFTVVGGARALRPGG